MTAAPETSRARLALIWFAQALEPIIVVAVGIAAILVERLPQELVLFALLLLMLPLLVRLFVLGRATTPTPANLVLPAFVLLLAITCWVTPSWRHTWPELARMIWGIAVCLAVINWLNPWPTGKEQPGGERRLLPLPLIEVTLVFIVMGIMFTAVGLLAMQHTSKVEPLSAWLTFVPRLYIRGIGSFNSNDVAGIIALFAPLALALALGPILPRQRFTALWAGWPAVKTLVVLLALFFCAALLLTQTRGAWVAVGGALVVMLSLLGRRGWILLALLAVMTAGTLVAIGPGRVLDELTVYDAQNRYQNPLTADRNLAARFILWQRALYGIADAPLTGMGLGGFAVVSQEPYPRVAGFTPDSDMTHVHNVVLQMGVDFGVPGVIVFVAFVAIIGRSLYILVRRAPSGLLHTWSVGLLGSFTAYLLYNMLNVTTLGARPAVAVWFLFGLCIGAGEWIQRQSRTDAAASASVAPHGRPVAARGEWERRAWAATTRASQD